MVKLRIDWFRAETIGAFKELRRYFELVESRLQEASQLERYVIEPKGTVMDWEEYLQEIQPELDAHEAEFKETLPRMLSYSLVSSLYTVVEYRLRGICNELKKRRSLPISVSKFRGKIVERVANFLKAFSLPKLLEKETQQLRDFILVRNCIVHNTGFVEGSRREKELRELIKSGSNDLSLNWEKRIVVSMSYCSDHLEAFLRMFRRLFKKLEFGPEKIVIEK